MTRRPWLAVVLAGCAIFYAVAELQAQLPAPRGLVASQELVIDGADHRFSDIAVSSTGRLAVLDGTTGGAVIRVMSADGNVISTVTPRDVGVPELTAFGWVGDTLWVTSRKTYAMVGLGEKPRAIQSRPLPEAVPGPRGTTPQGPRALVPYLRVEAAFASGGLLFAQTYPEAQMQILLRRPDLSTGRVPGLWVRTSASDAYEAYVTSNDRYLHDQCERGTPLSPFQFELPGCLPPSKARSPDGQFVVQSTTAVPPSNPTTVRIVKTRFAAETVFNRTYALPALPFTATAYDSASQALRNAADRRGPRSRAFLDSVLRADMPPFRQPITAILVGNDGSVYAKLTGGPDHRYLVLDPRGDIVGVVELPRRALVSEVREGAMWGILGPSPFSLVRYRIGP